MEVSVTSKGMLSKHYSEGYAPFSYVVYAKGVSDYVLSTKDNRRFYTKEDALHFAKVQINCLSPSYANKHSPFTISIYRDSFKCAVKKYTYNYGQDFV